MDPRLEAIENRLKTVSKLIPVASGKGGVGKSLVASTTALLISERNYEVGLLDLDLHGPSAHIILGANRDEFPDEEKGIIPSRVENIKFMSTVYYSRDEPSPLRGDDISNALKEILSITRWENLDYLVIDMPPGTGNETLDLIHFIKNSEFLLVTTPSVIALNTVKKLAKMLKELKVPISGIIENMLTERSPQVNSEIEELDLPYLGRIRYDEDLEKALGKPNELLRSEFTKDLRKILPLK